VKWSLPAKAFCESRAERRVPGMPNRQYWGSMTKSSASFPQSEWLFFTRSRTGLCCRDLWKTRFSFSGKQQSTALAPADSACKEVSNAMGRHGSEDEADSCHPLCSVMAKRNPRLHQSCLQCRDAARKKRCRREQNRHCGERGRIVRRYVVEHAYHHTRQCERT
jgi:hypothetical protein